MPTKFQKIQIQLLLFIIILFSCDSSKKTNEEKPKDVLPLEYAIESLNEKDSECTSNCSEVTINYPVFEESLETHGILNQIVNDQLNTILYNYSFDDSKSLSNTEMIKSFLDNYKKFKSEFPESNTPWSITIDVIVSYFQDNYISLAFNTSSYTGGAHSVNQVDYLNISKDGQILTNLSDFVKNIGQLKILAEEKFRTKHKLNTNQDLSEAGFIFDNNNFQLTENFGFTRNGLIFYYNSYEIAPYATGPTAISISFEELQKLQ